MKPAVLLGAVGLGFLLLLLSASWATLFPATSSWTAEKAARSAEIKNRLHNLAFIVNDPRRQISMHSGSDLGQLKAEYNQLKVESDRLNEEFRSAHNRPNTIATILKWSGITLAGLGILGWFMVREA